MDSGGHPNGSAAPDPDGHLREPTLAARLLAPFPRPVQIVIVAVLVTALVLAPFALLVWSL